MEWPEKFKRVLAVNFHKPKFWRSEIKKMSLSCDSSSDPDDDVLMDADDSKNFIHFGPMLVRSEQPTVLLFCSATRADRYQTLVGAATKRSVQLEIISTDTNLDKDLCSGAGPGSVLLFVLDLHRDKDYSGVDILKRLQGLREFEEAVGLCVIPATEFELLMPNDKQLIQKAVAKILPTYPSIDEWCVELEFAQRAVLPLQAKIRASYGLFSALDHVDNPIEITDSSRTVQFVNIAFEQMTGCRKNEVIGTTSSELRRKSLPRGVLCSTRHNDRDGSLSLEHSGVTDSIDWKCISVSGPQINNPSQVVHIKRAVPAGKNIYGLCIRRPSKHNNQVETPIAEVLTLLNEIEAASGKNEQLQTLIQKLTKLLNSTELYSPLAHFTSDDKVASDLFGGLVLNGPLQSNSRTRKPSLSETMRLGTVTGAIANAMRCTSPEVRAVLNLEPTWDFNILELERLTYKRPLVTLAMKIFQRCQVRDYLQCSESCLRAWLDVIENNYFVDNPYHNATHAADVLQATAYYIGKTTIAESIEHSHGVAALIAAVIHDVGHPGKGAGFLINARHNLSILYNDISVLENHHSALTFQLTLNDPHLNIFARLSRQDYTNTRKIIVDMVLATDMNKHFEHLAKFQQYMDSLHLQEPRTPENPPAAGFTETQKTVCRMLIKCADVSNPTRPFSLCKEWAYRIVEEYFRQTAEERAKGLPLTMKVFDRDTCNIPQTQCSFIDMFVRDMFKSWTSFGDMAEMMLILEDNYKRWKDESATWPASNIRPEFPSSHNSSATTNNSAEIRKGSEGSALRKNSASRSPLIGQHRTGHRLSSPVIPSAAHFTVLSEHVNGAPAVGPHVTST